MEEPVERPILANSANINGQEGLDSTFLESSLPKFRRRFPRPP